MMCSQYHILDIPDKMCGVVNEQLDIGREVYGLGLQFSVHVLTPSMVF